MTSLRRERSRHLGRAVTYTALTQPLAHLNDDITADDSARPAAGRAASHQSIYAARPSCAPLGSSSALAASHRGRCCWPDVGEKDRCFPFRRSTGGPDLAKPSRPRESQWQPCLLSLGISYHIAGPNRKTTGREKERGPPLRWHTHIAIPCQGTDPLP